LHAATSSYKNLPFTASVQLTVIAKHPALTLMFPWLWSAAFWSPTCFFLTCLPIYPRFLLASFAALPLAISAQCRNLPLMVRAPPIASWQRQLAWVFL
jgi:hypothetical protein